MEKEKDPIVKENTIKKLSKPIKLKLVNLLLIVSILVITLITSIYVIWNQYNQIAYLTNVNKQLYDVINSYGAKKSQSDNEVPSVEEDSTELTDKVGNDTTHSKEQEKSKITKHIKHSEMNTIPYTNEVPDSKLDYTIAYNGFSITEYPQIQSIDYIEVNDENTKKYSQTYCTYNKQGLNKKVYGVFGKERAYDSESFISNLSMISTSKDYNLVPRDYESLFDYSESAKKIREYLSDDNHSYILRIEKVDLNGDGDYIYMVESHGEVFIDVDDETNEEDELLINVFYYNIFNKNQEYVTTLYTLYDDFNDHYTNPDLNIIYADIDNDSKMEIILEIPIWEGPGYVSVYKYDNGTIIGDTNLASSILP